MLFTTSQRKDILILLALIVGVFVIPKQFRAQQQDFFWLPPTVTLVNDTFYVRKDSVSIEKFPRKTFNKHLLSPVELNKADSAALDAIPGIGPYYALKIIRYRERLGGYVSLQQLKELKMTYFNLDSSAHFFTIDSNLILKRDLDTMDFKAVLRHPYLEYEDVKLIFNAKRKYQYLSYSLLEEKGILPLYKLKKIKPYFK